ncbi:MAG: type II toxin-antitoxin system MqsR family toxin [Candidatus Marinimicrobia bacterium]|nr:type II toxin-antitoxin system MqsR family toxin [Candidatus Neomarinimicrobiota bacterium]
MPVNSKIYATPKWPLVKIRECINRNKYEISDKATICAILHFSWTDNEILRAIKALKKVHFYKSEPHRDIDMQIFGIRVDYYKAINLYGRNIYTHFHIDNNGILQIESFKEI